MLDNVKNLFISDVHLGSYYSKSDLLLDFLTKLKKQCDLENIYIVGDFVDGWKFKRNWSWNDQCNLLLRKLLSFVKGGTAIHWAIGNHDEFLRHYLTEFHEVSLGSIFIRDEFIHTTVSGKKYLIVHGDKFDFVTKYAKWLCIAGDISYEIILRINDFVNFTRRKFGWNHWSMSNAIKQKVKKATNFIGDFENFITKYAKDLECEGIVTGHIHTPCIKKVNDIDYLNCGDWMENCTAILELDSGEFLLYEYYKHGQS